jgi:hypothetical protein
MYYQGHEPDLPFRPVTIAFEWRQFDPPITVNGKKERRYQSPVVTEYVDVTTGEIIPAKDMKGRPGACPVVRFSENTLRRQAVLDSLREELRSLALFILAFRNNRRGVTPEVHKLVEWYAHLHGQRASNVRRNVKSLEKAGILAGSSLLCPLFQFSGKRLKSREHQGEDVAASTKYLMMHLSQVSPK